MNSLQIIPADSNDIDQLLVFMERFYAISSYPFNTEQTRASLKEFISSSDKGMIWIVKEKNIPIGYIILAIIYSFEFGGRNAFIDEFYLEKEFREKGIGKNVIEFVANEAKKMNIKALHLEVEQHNTVAIELYRKFNFNDHHRMLMTRML